MSFTSTEIELLKLSDALTTGRARIKRNVGGRPRKPCPDERTARRRASWRRYEDRKHDRLNAFGEPRKQGGRPRTKPDTPKQQRARERALKRYYERKVAIA